MSFYLTQPCQIRLKLPERTYEILIQDINDFRNVPEKEHISSFLNHMIKNFYIKAESTIMEKKPELRKKYLSWLESRPEAEAIADLLTGQTIRERKEVISVKYPYPKRCTGQSLKFIPDKAVLELLQNSPEDKIYGDNVANYLSSLIQEYASLPREQRELIFFGDNVQKMEDCIRKQQELEIVMYHQEVYVIRPYKLLTNGLSPWYYLIGYARQKNTDKTERLMSFRIQRIQSVIKRKEFRFSASEKKKLQTLLKKPSQISYLSGDPEEIQVRLTENGNTLYQHVILTNRPDYLSKKISAESIYLTFNCTQEQIYQYFIKFGKDAEIISPPELRERFSELHRTAAGYYQNS